jgi:hypothetical protein
MDIVASITNGKEDLEMKKLLLGTTLFAGLIVFPVMSVAQINIPFPLPPPIPFIAPPNVVVLPGTDVYAVPDVKEELFFRNGSWWRHHGGHWYRSKYYDRGWAYYRGNPSWHNKIPRDWRDRYRDHKWGGHSWNPPHVNHSNLNNHWRGGQWRNDHGWSRPGAGPGGRGGRDGHNVRGGGPGGRNSHDDRRDGDGAHRGERR